LRMMHLLDQKPKDVSPSVDSPNEYLKGVTMTFSKFILAFSLIGFLGTTGCSNNNYSSAEDGSEAPADGSNNGSSDDSQTEKEGETSFTFSASTSHTQLGGKRQVFKYDLVNERLQLLIPIPANLGMIGIEGSLPNRPDVTFELDTDENAIVINFPLKNYLEIVQNPTTLPNGRPLPGINGGEPPSFGFPIPFNNVNAYGYAAVDSISIFVELDMKFPLSFNVALTSDKDGSRVGKIYLLTAVNGYKGGIFLTLSLPDELSVLIANAQ